MLRRGLATAVRRAAAALPTEGACWQAIALAQAGAVSRASHPHNLAASAAGARLHSWGRHASGEAGPGPARREDEIPAVGEGEEAARKFTQGSGYYGADFLQETADFHDPKSTAGQTTWNLLWDGDEHGEDGWEGREVWECDFTGGAIPNNEINSLLSNKAKWEMYNLHTDNPEEFSVEHLAKKYRIRPQRVMAIIALKEMETKAIEEGKFTRQESDAISGSVDKELGAQYGEGTGERAYPHIATFPKFEYVTPDEAANQPGSGVDPVEALREEIAEKTEIAAIQEFKDRLDFGLGRVGKALRRGRRRRYEAHAGTGKSTILIKPLGKDQSHDPWVASPDGTTRQVTEDEALLLKKKMPKPRRKTLW